MSDDRAASRSFSDASPSLLLVDTRASQSLEPIRLPAKLRDRIERAQRRANAAKEGVSIFAKESKDSAMAGQPGPAGGRSTTAPAAETTTAATLGDIADPHRASTANGGPDDKMHLPDVVLSHKMRDFEARANTGGGVALFSVEPADRSLQRLSLEDRERVMLVMQRKIQQISSEVDENFARITKALDANGIFDSAANIQRAQTLCLVDLQRRCKLDRLRDEAMREVLHLPTSPKRKNSGQSAVGMSSHKLSQLLRPSSRAKSAETVSVPGTTASTRRRQRKAARVSKLPAIRTAEGIPKRRPSKNNQTSSSPLFRQQAQDTANNDGSKSPSLGRIQTRRGGLAPPSASSLLTREDVGFNIVPAIANTNDGDLYARHPYVAQVLQLLVGGETSNAKTSGLFNVNSAEADMELAKMLDPADEWIQRSPSYQAVGARGVEALRRSGERQRWDTLGHFGSRYVSSGIACIPVELRQRLEGQHSFWKKAGSTPRSDNGDEVNRALDAGKNIGNQQQRDTEVYAELQARIRERLIANERRTRTAAAAVRAVGASSKTQQLLPQTAPAKLMVTSTSAVSLPAGGSIPSRENQLQNPGSPSLALGMSASEPVLPVDTTMGADFTTPATDTQSLSPQRRSQLGTRGRLSVLEQKILVNPSQPISRHGRRKESLIGAPRAQLDTNAIGRHSEARIAYRRDTAQTWAWHLPPGAASGNAVGMIAEEENNEDKDRFDEEGDQCDGEDNSEEGEDGEDGTEYGDDDVESVDSSRTSFSGRSSMSMSSVKRRTGSGNKRSGKSKRPPVLQRRASRGPGGRSAGNTLTGHALSLHARLEVIWRVLQFPFSNKLAMLERLSTIQDADVFLSALEHWERVTPLVAIRQRMKLALSGFAERGELRPNEWLTTSEFALVAALSQSSSRNLPEPSSEAISPFKASIREFDSMSPSAFVAWVRDHIDAVTLQIRKLGSELKAHTGEELQFQGHPYPHRG